MAWTWNRFLQLMLERSATHLHLRPGLPVGLRLDGQLHTCTELPLVTAEQVAGLANELLDSTQKDRLQAQGQLGFGWSVPGLGRFRVQICRHHEGVALIVQVLPGHIPTVEELGLPATVVEAGRQERGLVLVTGGRRSGRSTVVASLLDWINRNRRVHVISLVRHIEYLHRAKLAFVTQREVGEDCLDFADGMQAITGQDADVVALGELGDPRLLESALDEAENGRLVFGIMSVQGAVQAIKRAVEMFPPDQRGLIQGKLANSLRLVLSQRLLVGQDGGLVAAREVLALDGRLGNLLRNGNFDSLLAILYGGRQLGTRSLEADLFELVQQQQISQETARSAAIRPEVLQLMQLSAALPGVVAGRFEGLQGGGWGMAAADPAVSAVSD
jgi:twitching motility protein PilT